MKLQQQFQALLGPDTAGQREQLGKLASHHPMEFRTWAVSWICGGGQGPGAHLLLRLLHRKNLLQNLLVNPGAMPLRDAIRVARLAHRSIVNFDCIVANTIREGTESQAARALQLLQHLPLTRRVIPGLAAALRNPNVRVRSLVSKLMGRLCDDPATIGELLDDTDSRVRANAVEGLWGSDHPMARELLRHSLRDSDNRVIANAALGLSKLGDPDAVSALHGLSGHADLRYRLSAIWCIEQIGDPGLLPLLDSLADDRVPKVREAAQTATDRVRHSELRDDDSLSVAVSHAYRTREGGLRLRASAIDHDDNPLDLSAGCFRVLQDQAALPHLKMRSSARRDALITILWLADNDLLRGVQDKAREALLDAMHFKRPDDLHCVVGSGIRSSLALSADLGQLSDVLNQASSGARSGLSESLHRALTLAASRNACRAVIAFSGGSPLRDSANSDRLVQQAVQSEIAVHVVVFRHAAVDPAWSQLASATQGSYREVQTGDELKHAFWCVLSRISSFHAITCGPIAEPVGEFRLEVRSATGHGHAMFKPLFQQHVE